MRILFLTNNEITQPLADWLRDEGHDVLMQSLPRYSISDYQGDFIISYNYKYIIGQRAIDKFPKRIINLHISYLPWNRGVSPNLWSWLEDTPKGVTIHYIDSEAIDVGEIIAREEHVFFAPADKMTLASTYQELHGHIQALFKRVWPQLKKQIGSYHSKADYVEVADLLGEEGWNVSIAELKQRWLDKKRKSE